MKAAKLYLLALAAWCAAGAAGAPRHDRHVQHDRHKKHALHGRLRKRDSGAAGKEQLTIELPEVLNNTVCPMRQEVDYDPNRVPQRIKMLKCARGASAVCRHADVARAQACCGAKHEHFHTQCVEVRDHVVVSDRSGAAPVLRTIAVSVGCSCMVRPTRAAHADD